MIIWSRWGILVLLCAGLGVGSGVLLSSVVTAVSGTEQPGNLFGGVGLVLGGVYVWLLDHYAMPHLDKPYQRFVQQPLPQPVTHPNGAVQTHVQVPIVDQQSGRPIWFRPRSSLFFIPVGIWPFILGGIGVVVVLASAVGQLVG